MSLSMRENASLNRSDYVRVLSMLPYIYINIIIIVTNVMMLEFLSAWFI